MQKKILVILSALCLLVGCNQISSSSISTSSTSITDDNYANPVWQPLLADPSIIRGDDNKFYAYGTQDAANWGDAGYTTPLVPILESPDLVNWTYKNAAFKYSTMPTWGTAGFGIWAPDIVKIGDNYLLYYSLSIWSDPNPGIGVAKAASPLGPWVDQGKLFTSDEIGVKNSIDPAVYEEDGHVYMLWGSFVGIYLIELTSDGLGLLNGLDYQKEHKILLAGTTSGFNSNNYEGAYLKKINGYYYLFLSTGSCCDGFNSSYKVVVARSESVTGPYVDKDGVDLQNRQSRGTLVVQKNDRFVGVGHNALIQDDANDWFLVYHGYDKTATEKEGTTNRRSLLIEKLLWDDGWPHTLDYGTSSVADRPVINL